MTNLDTKKVNIRLKSTNEIVPAWVVVDTTTGNMISGKHYKSLPAAMIEQIELENLDTQS